MNASSVRIIVSNLTGRISWNGNTAVFTPNGNLTAGTLYIVTVGGTDLAGNSLAPYSWNFTTKSEIINPPITTPVGNVSGVVTDENGAPIAGATITVQGTNISTTTDSAGHFLLENVSAGQHTILIGRNGFASNTTSITVTEGETTTINPMLHPISSQPPTNEFPWWLIVLAILVVVAVALLLAKKKGGKSKPVAMEGGEEPPAQENAAVWPGETGQNPPPPPPVPPEGPALEHVPAGDANATSEPSNDEMIANLEAAYKEGRISEDLYLRNLEKFRNQ